MTKQGDKLGSDLPETGGGALLEGRIRSHYSKLPESERRIADLILRFPGEVAAYTATELAELSGGSKAGVTRLIRRLGFENFNEARKAARKAQKWGSPLYLLSRDTRPNSLTARIKEHIKQDNQNISQTFEALDSDTLKDVVEGISNAKRVFILGFRNSQHLAGYIRGQIIQVRDNVHLLPAAGGTVAEEIAGMSSEDFVFVIGFRRRVKTLPKVMEIARKNGANILYLTDWAAEPSAHATWTIPCAVGGKDLFDRYASAISFLHFLSVEVVNYLSRKGRARLRYIEQLHEELEDFD